MGCSDWRYYASTIWHIAAFGLSLFAFAVPLAFEVDSVHQARASRARAAPWWPPPLTARAQWGWPLLTIGAWNVLICAAFFAFCAVAQVFPENDRLRRVRDVVFVLAVTEATYTTLLAGSLTILFLRCVARACAWRRACRTLRPKNARA